MEMMQYGMQLATLILLEVSHGKSVTASKRSSRNSCSVSRGTLATVSRATLNLGRPLVIGQRKFCWNRAYIITAEAVKKREEFKVLGVSRSVSTHMLFASGPVIEGGMFIIHQISCDTKEKTLHTT